MGFFSKKQIDIQEKYSDQSYHCFEDQLLWRYEDLKDRYLELLDIDAPASGDDYNATVLAHNDITFFRKVFFCNLHCKPNVTYCLEAVNRCITIIIRGEIVKDDEEDPNHITMFEIVLLPTWFQTAVAAA